VASEANPAAALAAVAERLRCPNCGARLQQADRALSCADGHSFDLARQGYVSLLPPRAKAATGDSSEMVLARERFLAGGHYAPIARALAAAARAAVADAAVEPSVDLRTVGPLVVDLGAGTGYYLAALLGELPASKGIALDASRPALRRAVRAHPLLAAIACDVWQELPLQDATADLVLSAFAPRNASEIARVLAADGALIVATPTTAHLQPLAGRMGMLSVDADKQARLRADLSPALALSSRNELHFDMELDPDGVQALVAMGPSARHLNARDVQAQLARLPREGLDVSASLVIETYRHSVDDGRAARVDERPRAG
jgi:23S rRNA (guanine745-N1)-methyltransferase